MLTVRVGTRTPPSALLPRGEIIYSLLGAIQDDHIAPTDMGQLQFTSRPDGRWAGEFFQEKDE